MHLSSKNGVLLFVFLDTAIRNLNRLVLRDDFAAFLDFSDDFAGRRLNILSANLVFIGSPGIGEF